MKKFTLLLALALTLTCSLRATNNNDDAHSSAKETTENAAAVYTLKGTVYDPVNEETLSGASITVDGKKYYSDLSGNFLIPRLSKGKYTVSVDFISYQPQTVEVNLTEDEELKIAIRQL